MSSIDQQFIEFVVKSLVNSPDAVQVERRIDEKGVLLELTVDPEDLGRVIGKRGGTAQSIRTLLRALGTKNDARYNLKIIDNGTGGSSHHDSHSDATDGTSGFSAHSGSAADDHTSTTDGSSAPQSQSTSHTNTGTQGHDDDLDSGHDASHHEPEHESDVVSKTRRELEEMDDLDV
jgi:predicted RNA-binding protein YlqC (UPF0109 family)